MSTPEINNVDDFNAMTRSSELVIVTTYRGSWCPFCLKYLKDLDQARKSLPVDTKIYGLSVDNIQENNDLKEKLALGFELISDENLISADLLGVAIGKGHGRDRYLQPSVFVYKNGVKVYQWIQKPKLINLGGAIGRLPIKELISFVCILNDLTKACSLDKETNLTEGEAI